MFSYLRAMLFCGLFVVGTGLAQVNPRAIPRVAGPIVENQRVQRGGVHPAVYAAGTQDVGAMADDRRLEHMQLQLHRPQEEERAVQAYVDSLNDPRSPNFRRFTTAAQFSERFGLAQSDIDAVTGWLTAHGFMVHAVYANLAVDFSGTAGQIRETFHTQLHWLHANGEEHFANMTAPEIPAALAGVVLGPVALHDFKPKPAVRIGRAPAALRPGYTVNANYQLVAPGDLQTIYNMAPVYAAGYSGQGQTVVLLERSDIYNAGDFLTFRKVFGLARNYPQGKLLTVHPQPAGSPTMVNGVPITPEACADPGVVLGDDQESIVDAEWATASAPNATIELASCKDTDTNFGAFIALENLLTAATPPPPIMSLSYVGAESASGAAGNAYINALYQLAAAEGVSIYVASGDADGDVTDPNQPYASHGINVNALASTPNNVAVGGTDYADTFLGQNETYWGANGPLYNSALSYVPEIPWNNSCASQLIALTLGYSSTYGADGFCNSGIGETYFLTTSGASGGPSGCAQGTPSVAGVVSGTCTGYAKPAYQSLVFGNPSDGVRDVPDVAMFAANGVWGHYFVLCYSNAAGGGLPCPTNNPSMWSGGGGTSFGAPIWAGIQALINQATGSPNGNPNAVFYNLAAAEYGGGENSACNSTQGNGTASTCIFYDVTLGDNDAACQPLSSALYNCYYPSVNPGVNGVLSLSDLSYIPSFTTATGYDDATGIGTPNVYNLVAHFPGSRLVRPH